MSSRTGFGDGNKQGGARGAATRAAAQSKVRQNEYFKFKKIISALDKF
jgi:catalase (peroxidase I)